MGSRRHGRRGIHRAIVTTIQGCSEAAKRPRAGPRRRRRPRGAHRQITHPTTIIFSNARPAARPLAGHEKPVQISADAPAARLPSPAGRFPVSWAPGRRHRREPGSRKRVAEDRRAVGGSVGSRRCPDIRATGSAPLRARVPCAHAMPTSA